MAPKVLIACEFSGIANCPIQTETLPTAVISQTGMARALGLSSRGNTLPRFLSNKVMSEAVGAELRQKIENPLKFQWGVGGAGMPPVTVHGFDSALLIDLCNAIINSEEKLGPRYAAVAKRHIVLHVP